jgi:hypothetical protein
VIVVSTNPRYLDQAEANQQRYGGNRFIAEPFDISQLLDAIHALIG